jgi:hypothetical protein
LNTIADNLVSYDAEQEMIGSTIMRARSRLRGVARQIRSGTRDQQSIASFDPATPIGQVRAIATVVVGLSGSGADDGGAARTLDLGAAGRVVLQPQGVQSDGISWYTAEVDDAHVEALLAALHERPDVHSAYVKPPATPAR